MTDNINEEYLLTFAKRLGINKLHGWKAELKRQLYHKSQSVINGWITRGVPREFDNILKEANIKYSVWEDSVREVDEEMASTSESSQIETLSPASSSPTLAAAIGQDPAEPPPQSPAPIKVWNLLQKAAAVLESETPFAGALKENIESFFYAVDCVHDLADSRQVIKEHEERLKAIEGKLSSG